MRTFERCFVMTGLFIPAFCAAQSISRPEVASLIDQGFCDAAADAYRDLYGDGLSQRAEVDLAMCYERSDRHAEALSYADAAIERNSYDWQWADLAFLTKARACSAIGCTVDAREAISTLRTRFPDALATAEADEVEADLDGLDRGQALAGIQTELAARDVHLQAVAAVRAGDHDRALRLFDSVIFDYPDTRQSLRSMKVRALLLGLMHDSNGAMDAWQEIAAILEPDAPNSALYYEAIYRIALLYQGTDRRDLALVEYDHLVANADDPKMVAKALWQRVGAEFEVLQRLMLRGETPTPRAWDALHANCLRLKNHLGARELFQVRADLIDLEAFHWQDQHRAALDSAREFVERLETNPKYVAEVATARLIYGERLQREGRHVEALEQYRIVETELDGREPWYGVEKLPRLYYRIMCALARSGAPNYEVRRAAEYVLENFPDTQFADLVQNARVQGFWQ